MTSFFDEGSHVASHTLNIHFSGQLSTKKLWLIEMLLHLELGAAHNILSPVHVCWPKLFKAVRLLNVHS